MRNYLACLLTHQPMFAESHSSVSQRPLPVISYSQLYDLRACPAPKLCPNNWQTASARSHTQNTATNIDHTRDDCVSQLVHAL